MGTQIGSLAGRPQNLPEFRPQIGQPAPRPWAMADRATIQPVQLPQGRGPMLAQALQRLR